ncbi:hypothetical protein [Aestuariivirga sp.]|uniref:hypothetical protein n=1 Tax=Aestuariivirga sp. TaxID=2650926 RepID=UPI0035941013
MKRPQQKDRMDFEFQAVPYDGNAVKTAVAERLDAAMQKPVSPLLIDEIEKCIRQYHAAQNAQDRPPPSKIEEALTNLEKQVREISMLEGVRRLVALSHDDTMRDAIRVRKSGHALIEIRQLIASLPELIQDDIHRLSFRSTERIKSGGRTEDVPRQMLIWDINNLFDRYLGPVQGEGFSDRRSKFIDACMRAAGIRITKGALNKAWDRLR